MSSKALSNASRMVSLILSQSICVELLAHVGVELLEVDAFERLFDVLAELVRVEPHPGADELHEVARLALGERGSDLFRATVAVEVDLHRGAGLARGDRVTQVARRLDGLAIDRGDDVADLEARLGGRALLLDARHQHAGVARSAQVLAQLGSRSR